MGCGGASASSAWRCCPRCKRRLIAGMPRGANRLVRTEARASLVVFEVVQCISLPLSLSPALSLSLSLSLALSLSLYVPPNSVPKSAQSCASPARPRTSAPPQDAHLPAAFRGAFAYPPPSRTKWTRLVHPSVLIGGCDRLAHTRPSGRLMGHSHLLPEPPPHCAAPLPSHGRAPALARPRSIRGAGQQSHDAQSALGAIGVHLDAERTPEREEKRGPAAELRV